MNTVVDTHIDICWVEATSSGVLFMVLTVRLSHERSHSGPVLVSRRFEWRGVCVRVSVSVPAHAMDVGGVVAAPAIDHAV
jgi:hypothetical protein